MLPEITVSACDSGIYTATAEGVKLFDKNALEEKSANTPYSHIMRYVLSTWRLRHCTPSSYTGINSKAP